MRTRFALLVTLGALLISFVSCGKASTPTMPTTPTTGNGSPVSIVAGASTKTTTAFNPNPITISRGGSVTWMNNDTTSHTSTSDSGMWNSGTLAPGAQFTATFSSAGTFTYHCAIHPGMVGSVVVQ
jgi:plastocyanin